MGWIFLSWEYNPEIPSNTCASQSSAGLLSLFLSKAPTEEKMVPEDASSVLTSEMLATERGTNSVYEKMTLKWRCELKPLTWTEGGNGRYQSSLQLGVPHCHTGQMRDQFYQTTGHYYYLFLKMCSTIAKTWTSGRFTKGFSRLSTKPSALKQL